MKKKRIAKSFCMAFTIVTMCVIVSSCGASKRTITNADSASQSRNPFGQIAPVPADIFEVDTDAYFGSTGIAIGSAQQLGQLQLNALSNAREMLQNRMAQAYKGVVTTYANSIGNNAGNDMQASLQRGVDNLLEGVLGATGAYKPPFFTMVDDKGNTTCYLSIRLNKNEIADKIANHVVDNVSEDEELQILFKEQEFRKMMKETFKEFKESK